MQYRGLVMGSALTVGLMALAGCQSTSGVSYVASQPTVSTSPIPGCVRPTETQVTSLFDRWNAALMTQNPDAVVATYAVESTLLPTLSNTPRYTPAQKRDYFVHFLANAPQGKIDERRLYLGCNMAVDTGIYTFTFRKTGEKATGRYTYVYGFDGRDWRIITHHSSLLPESIKAEAEQAVKELVQ